jgi:hypothetical protein
MVYGINARALLNLTMFVTSMKRVDFSEVTGVRALSFRNVSVGEIPPEAGRGAKLPHRYVAEKTSPGALELKKSLSSLMKYELCKASQMWVKKQRVTIELK